MRRHRAATGAVSRPGVRAASPRYLRHRHHARRCPDLSLSRREATLPARPVPHPASRRIARRRRRHRDGFAYRILYVDPGLVQAALGGKPLPFVPDPVVDLGVIRSARVRPRGKSKARSMMSRGARSLPPSPTFCVQLPPAPRCRAAASAPRPAACPRADRGMSGRTSLDRRAGARGRSRPLVAGAPVSPGLRHQPLALSHHATARFRAAIDQVRQRPCRSRAVGRICRPEPHVAAVQARLRPHARALASGAALTAAT